MKKLILFILVVISAFTSYAQAALDSFYQTGATNTFYIYTPLAHFRGHYGIYKDYIVSDTLVKGKTYKVIEGFQKGIETFDFNSRTITRSDTTLKYTKGGIRVDGEKVYILNLSADTIKKIYGDPLLPLQETILYDFDLSIGDTLHWKPYNNVVLDIDSVKLSNGKYEKRFFFNKDTSYYDYWIRGVGSSLGFLYSYVDAGPYAYPFQKYRSVCFDGSVDHKFHESADLDSAMVNSCYIILPTSVANVSKEEKVELFPNPVVGNAMNINLEKEADLTIYNMQGQLIHRYHNLERGKHRLEAPSLPGVYVMYVHSDVAVSHIRFEKL